MKTVFYCITIFLFSAFTLNAQTQVKTKPVEPPAKNTISEKSSIASKPEARPVVSNTNGIITLQWVAPHKETIGPNNETSKMFIGFKGATYDAGAAYLPEYFKRTKLNASTNKIKVTLSNTTFEPLTSAEISAIGRNKSIGSDVKIIANVIVDRMEPYAQVSILPIRKNPSTGDYEKLVSFKINVQETTEVVLTKKKDLLLQVQFSQPEPGIKSAYRPMVFTKWIIPFLKTWDIIWQILFLLISAFMEMAALCYPE